MFKTILLAAYVAVSFTGAFLTACVPAAADDYDDLMDSEREAQSSFASSGAGAGKVTVNEF